MSEHDSGVRTLDEIVQTAAMCNAAGGRLAITVEEAEVLRRAMDDLAPRACGHVHSDLHMALVANEVETIVTVTRHRTDQ